jgi:hypothetical protein
MSDSVCVRTFATTVEAGIAKGVLESHGIKTAVMADDVGGTFPPMGNQVKLLVLEEDLQKAKDALDSAADR